MNSSTLVILDSLFAPIFKLLALIVVQKNRILSKTFKSDQILVIKIMGAGNFVASEKFNSEKYTILTSKNNEAAVKYFYPEVNVLSIEVNGIWSLASSLIIVCCKLIFQRYDKVYNFEVQSALCKFISSIPFSKKLVGISISHKSFFDYIFYHQHIVLSDTPRSDIIDALLDEHPRIHNENISKKRIYHSNNLRVINQERMGSRKLVIAPTCANVDLNRRVDIKYWEILVSEFATYFDEITCVFQTKSDFQFQDFCDLQKRYENIQVITTRYVELTEVIRAADFVATVDSQALHISQKYDKYTLCFYGPSSPFSVSLGNKTLVISSALNCSPCTHLYFEVPCKGGTFCRAYAPEEIRTIAKMLTQN